MFSSKKISTENLYLCVLNANRVFNSSEDIYTIVRLHYHDAVDIFNGDKYPLSIFEKKDDVIKNLVPIITNCSFVSKEILENMVKERKNVFFNTSSKYQNNSISCKDLYFLKLRQVVNETGGDFNVHTGRFDTCYNILGASTYVFGRKHWNGYYDIFTNTKYECTDNYIDIHTWGVQECKSVYRSSGEISQKEFLEILKKFHPEYLEVQPRKVKVKKLGKK